MTDNDPGPERNVDHSRNEPATDPNRTLEARETTLLKLHRLDGEKLLQA
jgi:hypothetical protein